VFDRRRGDAATGIPELAEGLGKCTLSAANLASLSKLLTSSTELNSLASESFRRDAQTVDFTGEDDKDLELDTGFLTTDVSSESLGFLFVKASFA
jgi:hypothetical protein